MGKKLITIPGVSWGVTQKEIDLIKAYEPPAEPPAEKLYLALITGDWDITDSNYLVLQGRMLETAKNSILFNHANKENN